MISKKRLIFYVLITFVMVGVVKLGFFFYYKTIDVLDGFVVAEQQREVARLEEIIDRAEKNLNDLEVKLQKIEKSWKVYLSDDESDDLLKTLAYMENDALKIENALTGYYNDLSIHLYPRKNKVIDEKIGALWNTHIVISRLVRNVEDIAFGSRIYRYQINTSYKNIEKIRDDINEMRRIQ